MTFKLKSTEEVDLVDGTKFLVDAAKEARIPFAIITVETDLERGRTLHFAYHSDAEALELLAWLREVCIPNTVRDIKNGRMR